MSYPKKTLKERLAPTGQKKLLALDGGGIRGLMSIEVLAAIENTLRDKLGAGDDFVLADYFDYVAGTSTGAIMATGISLGWPVDKLRQLYLQNGEALFSKASLLKRFRFMYEDDKLARMLQEYIGKDTTLASDELRTLLMVVMRNASTDSPWPLSSNPAAKYNDLSRPDSNLRIPLWQLVRASTAAPVYFPPEVVDVGKHQFVFVDGGVTTYNDPAFILFLMATLEPYKLGWPSGEENMLVVSVGTGTSPKANEDLEPD
ncbi:MAG TPA: patatin-like phospholipase family protein, partial [Gemmatimonadota bacterium]|nr:patatin-like phospholipase family protein [Gemmatimonadota bacterium]